MLNSHSKPMLNEFMIFIKYFFTSGSILLPQGTNKDLNATESPLKTLKSTLE